MAEEGEGKQGDMHYYQNQPYDLEVDLNQENEDGQDANKGEEKKSDTGAQQDEQTYQEAVVNPPEIKALPKFDISKFEEINASPEAKELLSIMKT